MSDFSLVVVGLLTAGKNSTLPPSAVMPQPSERSLDATEPQPVLKPSVTVEVTQPEFSTSNRLTSQTSPVLIPPTPLKKGGNPVKVPLFKGDLGGSINVLPLNQKSYTIAASGGNEGGKGRGNNITPLALQERSRERGLLAQMSSPNASQEIPAATQPNDAGLENIADGDESADPMSQLTSVDQLTDVTPEDWSYQALKNLTERYGVISGYPDGSFRGNRSLSRYEFAAALNAALEKIFTQPQGIPQDDLATLQRLQQDYATELAEVKGRVDNLESRTAQLENHQFSTNTRLFGQAIVGLQGSNQVDVDLFPRDGVPERSGQAQLTLASNVQLSLATSFTGQDLLLTGLQGGNLASSAPFVFTNMGRLSTELETNNDLVLSDLSYRFPVTDNFGVIVGPAGVNPANTFRGINPLEGSGDGSISLLGQRNPILSIGNGTGGIGFDWQINKRLSLQAVYSAELPGFTSNSSQGGLFGGRTSAGVQFTIAPTNNLDIGLHYIYSHSPDGLLGIGTGDNQLISPLAPIISPSTSFAFNTHAVGGTLAWRVNPRLTLGTWGGWTSSDPVNLSGSVETTNWMLFSAFPDLFGRGNLGGILFGQPPKITSSTLPDGFNLPNFLTNLSGTPGGRRDTALHLELFYRARLTDNIFLTPGVLVVFNPDHNAANDTLVVGTMRATFRF
ncbi:carbohydrate porin [Coleofasciculus sp. FACHB-64]|uniref:iron uptake porin n=1 Tax=Cyanophyceae TaxID=3028117 RepID=UPI001685BF76|nr:MULTISPECIES: iron uptake porin [unclassified Coleofasciculus]MBD1839656.1 carbohydrate porin [Coleofasciculus sp. FACHB-501]MBD2046591.1 carbohydrate porin [Coleofasciculus sp. FACHB-64]